MRARWIRVVVLKGAILNVPGNSDLTICAYLRTTLQNLLSIMFGSGARVGHDVAIMARPLPL